MVRRYVRAAAVVPGALRTSCRPTCRQGGLSTEPAQPMAPRRAPLHEVTAAVHAPAPDKLRVLAWLHDDCQIEGIEGSGKTRPGTGRVLAPVLSWEPGMQGSTKL